MPECFVIMGFGTKHDPDTGRTLNLDSSYEHIIKPAVEGAGYDCIRADEIQHSGVIDRPMYEKLLQADLVVADITTANANAIYELGVRHALRPHSTIVIKEQSGKRYFDLNHLATVSYKHLGEEIGAGEARRKSVELRALIERKRDEPRDDSPVYEYLRGLTRPVITVPGGRRSLAPAAGADEGPSLAMLRTLVEEALDAEDFLAARRHLEYMVKRGFSDPPTIQTLAQVTYRSGTPDKASALAAAREVIKRLTPLQSTDPNTLDIAGAFETLQWRMHGDATALDDAIQLYRRRWGIQFAYQSGEQFARCLEMRSEATTDLEESAMDRMDALRVRRRLVAFLEPIVKRSGSDDYADCKGMLAELSIVLVALGDESAAAKYEQQFRAKEPARLELETFEAMKRAVAEQAQKYATLRMKLGTPV